MAIQIGASSNEGEADLNATINTTPLVDVMLVLLIIFLITIPVVVTTIPLHLPEERNQPTQTKAGNITIAVDVDGNIYWNNAPVPDLPALQGKLKSIATEDPQPEVHIRGDQETRFIAINRVVEACKQAAITKVSFITIPTATEE